MRILVTGGNGYIAKSLIAFLNQKHEVSVITRQLLDLTKSNEVEAFFQKKYFDVVIHCAVVGGSRLRQEDATILDQNLQMYYNLLSQRDKYDKLIHFGSGAEWFLDTPYGWSKNIIHKSLLEKHNFFSLRIFGIFDENEWDTRFIKTCIKNYIDHKPISILQDKRMDFFYMKDLVSLVDYYINALNPPKELNCCYEHSLTLQEIALYINSLGDHKVEILVENENTAPAYTGQYNNMPIPLLGLKAGIQETYKNIKDEQHKLLHQYSQERT